MKTLMLVRHAKSSWDDSSLADHDRPLAPRGRAAAPRVAHYMADEGLQPALVLCSTALRTRQTWELMAADLGQGVPVLFLRNLYGAGPGEMLDILAQHGGDAPSVMLLAHNPGTEELAQALSGTGSDPALRKLYRKYPTGALAVIDLDTDAWSDIRSGQGVLRLFVRPKDL